MTHTAQDLLNVVTRQRDDARNAEAAALAELHAANRKIAEQAGEIEALKSGKAQKLPKAKPASNGKEAHA